MSGYVERLRLDGQGFVIVGAGHGIGRETALALRSVGADLVCVDIDEESAKAVAADVGGMPCVADVRDRQAVESVVTTAQKALGRIDGLVDIVGMSRFARLVDMTDEDFGWTTDMVLRHVFLCLQLVGPVMTTQGSGSMVFVSSVVSATSAPYQAAYGAAKAALGSLVRTAAVELGPAGVRVNAVAPGVVRTPRVNEAAAGEGLELLSRSIPLGTVAETTDIAAAILFLSSSLARHVTGQTLFVDGGATVKFPYPMELLSRKEE